MTHKNVCTDRIRCTSVVYKKLYEAALKCSQRCSDNINDEILTQKMQEIQKGVFNAGCEVKFHINKS